MRLRSRRLRTSLVPCPAGGVDRLGREALAVPLGEPRRDLLAWHPELARVETALVPLVRRHHGASLIDRVASAPVADAFGRRHYAGERVFL
jgi:hypothetical protein